MRILLFAALMVLACAPPTMVSAETVIITDLSCYHLKTLQLIDQLPAPSKLEIPKGPQMDLIKAQIKAGECSFYFGVGRSVRVEQRFEYPLMDRADVCIAPVNSSEPCQWISSKYIK